MIPNIEQDSIAVCENDTAFNTSLPGGRNSARGAGYYKNSDSRACSAPRTTDKTLTCRTFQRFQAYTAPMGFEKIISVFHSPVRQSIRRESPGHYHRLPAVGINRSTGDRTENRRRPAMWRSEHEEHLITRF